MMDKKQLLADAYALASNIDALAGVLLTACTELVNQDSVSSPFDAGTIHEGSVRNGKRCWRTTC
jgi:hypothetical protein